MGRRKHLDVFGRDWPTPDGSGVRDFIHVMVLAECHRDALNILKEGEPPLLTMNLGSGTGYSVLEVVAAFEKVSGRPIPFNMVEPSLGDAAISVADPLLAPNCLGWRAKRSLIEMCHESWSWQCANPTGYLLPISANTSHSIARITQRTLTYMTHKKLRKSVRNSKYSRENSCKSLHNKLYQAAKKKMKSNANTQNWLRLAPPCARLNREAINF